MYIRTFPQETIKFLKRHTAASMNCAVLYKSLQDMLLLKGHINDRNFSILDSNLQRYLQSKIDSPLSMMHGVAEPTPRVVGTES
jgi:hypothetical protein